MCRLRNIAMRDYQESVTTRQTHRQTNGWTDRQTPDTVIPMCCYSSQATQKLPLDTFTLDPISDKSQGGGREAGGGGVPGPTTYA